MHICLVLALIHHSRGRSKHAPVISFLLPRLINNSWVTIAGGGSQGETGDIPRSSPYAGSPQKTGRGNQSLALLWAEREKQTSQCSHPLTASAKQTIFTIIIADTTAPVQAFLTEAITFSFPFSPRASLWIVLTPSLRALIKKHVPNGSWQAAPIMGCSPSLHLPHASGNTNSSSLSTAACLATARSLMAVDDMVSLTIKHLRS